MEPFVHECPEKLVGFNNLEFVDVDDALRRADILLVLVDHDRFKRIDREQLARKVVIDTRGIFVSY